MEIHFLVMEKSWKIIVEKEWSPWYEVVAHVRFRRVMFCFL